MSIHILHIIGRMNVGGAETFIMNIYRNIDRNKIQFDFVVHTKERCAYDDEIEKLGGKIYRIPELSKHPIKNMIELAKILKQDDIKYSTVHRHTNTSIVFTDLIISKIMKVKKIIVHSHSTNAKNPILHKIFRPFMRIANIRYACSKEAGKWLFGKNVNFTVINNGIDLEKYKVNDIVRNEVRKELNINPDEILLGHIGRFNKAKNHNFLVDIFYELQKDINAKLVLVGTGELENDIKNKVKEMQIENKVIFLGLRKDVYRILQAMDIFVFPSLYEGLGISLIEAQVAGLPCLVSNAIQDEAIITNNVKKLSIERNNIKEWIENIENISRNKTIIDREINQNDSKIKKFNIIEVTKKLEEIYIGDTDE